MYKLDFGSESFSDTPSHLESAANCSAVYRRCSRTWFRQNILPWKSQDQSAKNTRWRHDFRWWTMKGKPLKTVFEMKNAMKAKVFFKIHGSLDAIHHFQHGDFRKSPCTAPGGNDPQRRSCWCVALESHVPQGLSLPYRVLLKGIKVINNIYIYQEWWKASAKPIKTSSQI